MDGRFRFAVVVAVFLDRVGAVQILVGTTYTENRRFCENESRGFEIENHDGYNTIDPTLSS
jgi:hypothetical protein